MPSEGGKCFQTAFQADAAFRVAPLRRFPTYPICSEHIYEKEKNTAPGNLFGGFVCLYGNGSAAAPGR